jgi:hypothetical protein
LAKKRLFITLAAVAVALVLVNVIFSYVVAEPERDTEKRCAYSLLRLSVALVEYANVKNTTLTPPSLRKLVEEGIVEESWLRCSEYSSEFGYFGQFDLLGPMPPLILWCKSGHSVEIEGQFMKTTYVISDRHRVSKCTFSYLEDRLKEIDAIRDVLASDPARDREKLLDLAKSKKSSYIGSFAVWKLAQTRLREFEKTYIGLLDDRKHNVGFEAALGLALIESPGGGAALMTGLRDADYFVRTRAFRALKELTGDSFGFNPALDPESQPKAAARFDDWWARTVKRLRAVGDSAPGD